MGQASKLVCVLRLQKVNQRWLSGIKQLGLRPEDPRTHLKVAGEKLCSSARGSDAAQMQQEDRPAPHSALKNEQQDKRQRRDLSPAKPINNSQEVESLENKMKSALFFSFPWCYL